MREINHDTLRYEGAAGESIVIKVTAVGTAHIVTVNVDGAGATPLPAGQDVRLNFKGQSGARLDVQLRVDFNPNGRYDIVVQNVANCQLPISPSNQCLHSRTGPSGSLLSFKFFTV
jgi:hypothetical protein